MPNVFVSHATEDLDAVKYEIVARLAAHNVHAWLSCDNIRGGSEWERAIYAGLDECDVFIVALSPSSVDSPWVKREVEAAFQRPNVRIVPVLLKECAPEHLHCRLSAIEHVDFRTPDSLAEWKLLDAVGVKTLRPVPIPRPPSKASHQNSKLDYEGFISQAVAATMPARLFTNLCTQLLLENSWALDQFQRSDLWQQQPDDLRRECEENPERLINMAVRLVMHELVPILFNAMKNSAPAEQLRFLVETALRWIPYLVRDNNMLLADAFADALWPILDSWGDRKRADWLLYRRYTHEPI